MPRHADNYTYSQDDFKCKISNTLMAEPAELPCGHNFETTDITTLFEAQASSLGGEPSCLCPANNCRARFAKKDIQANLPLEKQINDFAKKTEDAYAARKLATSFFGSIGAAIAGESPIAGAPSKDELVDFRRRQQIISETRTRQTKQAKEAARAVLEANRFLNEQKAAKPAFYLRAMQSIVSAISTVISAGSWGVRMLSTALPTVLGIIPRILGLLPTLYAAAATVITNLREAARFPFTNPKTTAAVGAGLALATYGFWSILAPASTVLYYGSSAIYNVAFLSYKAAAIIMKAFSMSLQALSLSTIVASYAIPPANLVVSLLASVLNGIYAYPITVPILAVTAAPFALKGFTWTTNKLFVVTDKLAPGAKATADLAANAASRTADDAKSLLNKAGSAGVQGVVAPIQGIKSRVANPCYAFSNFVAARVQDAGSLAFKAGNKAVLMAYDSLPSIATTAPGNAAAKPAPAPAQPPGSKKKFFV
jgi:hypothetical protein